MKGNFLKGITFASRGERRYALHVWQFTAVAMFAVIVFVVYRDNQLMKDLANQQYMVYEVDRRGAVTVHPAEEYQLGPLQVEIESMATSAVRWITQAGSSDVETARTEAVKLMTEDMARDFESSRGEEWVEKIKKLNIYRKGEIFSRPLKAEDLPAEERNKIRITKYDIVVYGKVQTYRRGSGDLLDESNFATLVTLIPLEARTKENTSALLVHMMRDLDPKVVMAVKNQTAPETESKLMPGKSSPAGNSNSNSESKTEPEAIADTVNENKK